MIELRLFNVMALFLSTAFSLSALILALIADEDDGPTDDPIEKCSAKCLVLALWICEELICE